MTFHVYKDEKNLLVHVEVDGRIVATVPIGEWSRAIALPKKVNGDERFDFSRSRM